MAKDKNGLTDKQKRFCEEYCYDWNGTRAYKAAYKGNITDVTAGSNANKLLKNTKIQKYIDFLRSDTERLAGISRLKILEEHLKLAFSSIAEMHNTWITRKDFKELTKDQKACIQEITTNIRRDKKTGEDIEMIKVKLYDKQKSLEAVAKMLGYNDPDKIDHTTLGGKIEPSTIEFAGKKITF